MEKNFLRTEILILKSESQKTTNLCNPQLRLALLYGIWLELFDLLEFIKDYGKSRVDHPSKIPPSLQGRPLLITHFSLHPYIKFRQPHFFFKFPYTFETKL